MWNDLFCEILCVWICIIHIVTEKIYCFYLDLVWMQKEKQSELHEKGKHDAYNTDHRFWPKSLWQPSEGKN